MTIATIMVSMLAEAEARLLQPPAPRGNLFVSGFGALLGVALLVAWVRLCPRLKVKRFSLWFWAGLAVCAIIGPIIGGLFQ